MSDVRAMRWARGSAWLLWAVTLVVAAAGLALVAWDWPAPVPAGLFGIRGFDGVFAVCFGGVGALLTWRHPGHPVSWILAAAGLASAVNFATIEYGLAASAGRRHLPAAEYAGWVQQWIWVPLIALITVYLFLLFPDGHLPSPRWRPVGWLGGAFAIIATAGIAFNPGSERPNLPGLRNPLGVTPAAVPFDAVMAGLAGLLGCVVLAAWSLAVRSRRGSAVQRHQIGVYAGLVLLATRVLGLHTPVVVAAATLAAAALFSPIRLRAQRMVDRRFNRARYDAEATVTAFAARLKDAVDLDTVRDDLVSLVQTALEPAHLRVWTSQRD